MLNTKLFIGSKIEQPKNVYLLDIELMHGDGDAYTHIELKFEDVDAEKEKLITILDILGKLGGYDHFRKYHCVEGFNELLHEDWDRDSTCEDYLASYDGYKLYYLNEDGEKFNVKVINRSLM